MTTLDDIDRFARIAAGYILDADVDATEPDDGSRYRVWARRRNDIFPSLLAVGSTAKEAWARADQALAELDDSERAVLRKVWLELWWRRRWMRGASRQYGGRQSR